MTEQMFPRPPRRMKQPTKDALRQHLAVAATRIEQLTAENEVLRRPWWRRIPTPWRRAPKDPSA